MKILAVNNRHPNHSVGGATILCGDICRGLEDRGHLVKFLAPGGHGLMGLKPVRLVDELRTPAAKLKWLIASRYNYGVLARTAKSERPDAIYLHNLEWITASPLLAAMSSGARTVVHCHNHSYANGLRNSFSQKKQSSAPRRFFRLGFPLNGFQAIAISECIARGLAEAGFDRDRISVIYNGLPEEVFAGSTDGPRERKALFAGAVASHKGVHLALEALGILRKRGINLKLDIVGQIVDQNYRKQLESIIEKDGLEGQVSFAGQLERRELWQRMRRATMVWVPSLCEEAFGLVAAEAMACGAVAVVSNRGALPEVVGDAGIVAEPTAEAWAADAAGVLAMPEGDRATLAQAAAKRARDKFRLSKVVKQVESVLTGKNHA